MTKQQLPAVQAPKQKIFRISSFIWGPKSLALEQALQARAQSNGGQIAGVLIEN